MTERPGSEPAHRPAAADGTPPPLDDLDLLGLLAADLEAGLRCALAQCFPAIRGLLRSEFGPRFEPEVDDAINHAACRLAEKHREFDPGLGTLRAWLYRIAKHRVLDQLRRQRGEEAWPEDALDRIASQDPKAPDERAEPARDRSLRDALDILIRALPRLQQAVVRADLSAGGTADANDLAEQLQSSPNAIYVARHRARKKLASQLRDQGHGQ